MFTRFRRGAAPARRIIGTYGAITLEEARRTAGEWRSLIAKGIDPAAVEKAKREKEAREAALRVQHSFAAVAETFIADKMAQERDGKDAERVMRTTFVAAWADRPIGDITALDVLEIVNRKKRHAPQQARALMVLARRFFNWACDAHVYGLDRSPLWRASPFGQSLAADQERLRRIGERLGMASVAETLRRIGAKLPKVATAPPSPQEPTPQEQRRKPRKTGGGNKPKLEEKQIERGKETYRSMLDEDPTWAENQTASAKRVIEKLKLGNSVSWQTVKRWIVAPVLKERRSK